MVYLTLSCPLMHLEGMEHVGIFFLNHALNLVVVLSINDGCAISRSDEAKKLGIPMGAPIFKYKSIINQDVRFEKFGCVKSIV